MIVVLAIFAVAFGAVALAARRRPVLARLAWREAVRRPGQAALVVCGLMVGTATITAAGVAADSVGQSVLEALAYRSWGQVDLIVTAGGRGFPADVAARLREDPAVRRVTDGVAAGLEVPAAVADLSSRQGSSGVLLVGFDPAAEPPFGAFTTTDGRRTYGDDLAPDEVLLSRVLAEAIDARPGHLLRISAEAPGGAPRPAIVRVAGVARAEGPGAYTLRAAVFAPLPLAGRLAGTDLVTIVRVSTPGGVRGGIAGGRRAAPVLARAVRDLAPDLPLAVRRVKEAEAEAARRSTEFIRAMLLGMSALVVAAGAMLVVNLMGMLAEERRPGLGVLRALGLPRRGLVALATIEGALYSLAAGAVGAALGALAGRVVAGRFGRAFAQLAGEEVDFRFAVSVRPSTLFVGFTAGSTLTLAVVWLAARRTARMTITTAIRNLPEPPHAHLGRPGARRAAGAALGLGGATGIVVGEPLLRMVGGLELALGAAVLVRRRLDPRLHATGTGLALAGWSFSQIAGRDPGADPATFFAVFVLAMLGAAFGLTILASANLSLVERAAALAGRAVAGLRAGLRPPLAYLARRPIRTGLTTGVFAVVIGMLSLFAVFSAIFRPDYERFGGGYDVRVMSTGSERIELPAAVAARVRRRLVIPTRGYVGPLRASEGRFADAPRIFLPIYVLEDLDPAAPPVRLESHAAAYADDRAVWEAVRRDPRVVVANVGAPGGTITLEGPAGPVTFRVAGAPPVGLLDGIFLTPRHLASLGPLPTGVSMLLDLGGEREATAVARALERALFEQGVEADSVRRLLDDAARASRTFFSTIDILMRMGLVVGILALGIVALRVVVERRHVIGVLRALGYTRRAVMAGLLAEAVATASVGAAVGASVGVIMGYLFYRQGDAQGPFGLDWASFGGVLGLVAAATALVTPVPAWRAARLSPAEAVRYSE